MALKTLLLFSAFAWLALSFSTPRNAQDAPTAKTNQATYIGFTDTKYSVDTWAGVPYAKPPLAALRLQHPQPYDAHGTIQSQTYGHRCFEIGKGISLGEPTGETSEDCLVLNIYAPSKVQRSKRWHHPIPPYPVLVYSHGGGFNQGSGNDYKGQSLVNYSVELKSPVIVVTVNYRLSFLGFSGSSQLFPKESEAANSLITSWDRCHRQQCLESWSPRSAIGFSMGS